MRRSGLLSVGAAVLVATASMDAQSSVSPLEASCARGLANAAVRLAAVWARETIECRIAVAAGEANGPCPGVVGESQIAPIDARLNRRAALLCGSYCSISDGIRCVANDLCPPLPANGAAEACTAGAANRPFDMRRIGFPGPFCENAIGHPLVTSADIAECVHSLALSTSYTLADTAFGEVGPGVLTDGALDCQRVIARRTRRLSSIAHATLTRCRNAILNGVINQSPDDCARLDPDYLARTAINEAKLISSVLETCSDTEIAELDICGAGTGGVATAADAIECSIEAAYEIASSPAPPALRRYSSATLIESAFPPAPACGDDSVNQIANAFLPLGEECDGNDDSACPGLCIPPGDLFQCSCADRPRLRFLAESAETDLDHGWTGLAMNVTLPEGSGFTMDLASCDCDEMDGATCVGATADSVCSVSAAHRPRCGWDSPGAPRCDARGNGNFVDEDQDCWICDRYSANPGDGCRNEQDCDAQCYDANGDVARPCHGGQPDCATGEVCRGQCDRQQTCIIVHSTPPVPVASSGSPICIVQTFRDDLSGTTDVVTGEHEIFQRTRVKIHLGMAESVPCPVCGGFCEDGPFAGETCSGTCSAAGSACRFESDCPAGETCTSVSEECPEGRCNLSLICHGGPNDNAPCRIESDTETLGTVSNDCPPPNASNISGNGLIVDYLPATSEAVELASRVPCTAPGYELYDCPCPADGGFRTKPNQCGPACDAGAEAGVGCADGDNASGRFTTCASGINDGLACDEDTDCPGSSCTNNPHHCVGDPAREHVVCATNADCGLGECADACPSGRCVPLCAPRLDDPEDGVCAAGPAAYHCSGALEQFRNCGREQAEGTCAAQCDTSHTACAAHDACPPGEACVGACETARFCEAGSDGVLGTVDDVVGSGICVEDSSACPLDPVAAEGGDVFNSKGGPANPRSVATFCLASTSSPGLNATVGIGGPGRLRRVGRYVTNGFAALP